MRTVLITGANRGLGLEFVRQYAADGWKVYAACRHPSKAEDLRHIQGNITMLTLDITSKRHIKAIARKLKDQPIDVLIHNGAISGPTDQTCSFGNLSEPAWLELMQVNVIAPFKLTEALVDNVKISRQKKIVFISSRSSSIAERGTRPYHQQGGTYVYRSTKAALNCAAQSLAFDMTPQGISVIVLSPGWVKTDMGGPEADIDAVTSVTGMRSVIAASTVADNKKFRSYDGEVIPW